jgi:hypothetical protein
MTATMPDLAALLAQLDTAMAARYQHIIAAIRRDVAVQVGGLLWSPTEDQPGDEDGGAEAPQEVA